MLVVLVHSVSRDRGVNARVVSMSNERCAGPKPRETYTCLMSAITVGLQSLYMNVYIFYIQMAKPAIYIYIHFVFTCI